MTQLSSQQQLTVDCFLTVARQRENLGRHEGTNRWVHLIRAKDGCENVTEADFNEAIKRWNNFNAQLLNHGLVTSWVPKKQVKIDNELTSKCFHCAASGLQNVEVIDGKKMPFWSQRWRHGGMSEEERKLEDRNQRRLTHESQSKAK